MVSRYIHCIYLLLLVLAIYSCGTENKPVYTLSVAAEPEEAGVIAQEKDQAEEGEAIQITATPNEHWEFVGWSGDLSGTEETTVYVHMDRDRKVIALFEKVEYPLTVSVDGEGIVEQEIVQAKTIDYQHGTVVRLTAVPDFGWEFVKWSGDYELEDSEIEIFIEGEIEVQAHFKPIDFEIIFEVEGEGSIKHEVLQAKTISTEYPFGSVILLTAIPESGWEFVEWSGDVNGDDDTIEMLIDGEKYIKATFQRKIFTLTIHENGNGSVDQQILPALSVEYPFETNVQLTALPDTNWEFVEWSGDMTGTNGSMLVTIDRDLEITANFKLIDYTLTVQINGQGTVIQNGTSILSKKYPFGTRVTLEGLANNGWVFSGWSGGTQSSNNPIEVLVDGDKTIQLNFQSWPSTVRILQLGDSITNGFPYTYRYGLSNSLVAAGYAFNFVGTRNTNPANYPGIWDTRHEGHNGTTTTSLSNALPNWISGYSYDIALIHTGTNDILLKNTEPFVIQNSKNNVIKIIRELRKKNPVTRIYLAKIIPLDDSKITSSGSFNTLVNQWNNELQQLANQYSTSASPIYIVDMNTNFSISALPDGIHPDNAGAQEMAKRWFNAIISN